MNNYTNQINSIVNEVKKAVVGKDSIIIKVLLAILCKGQYTYRRYPGSGKNYSCTRFFKGFVSRT